MLLHLCILMSVPAEAAPPATAPATVTLLGNMFCNGACIADPKPEDHVMALYAIEGTPDVRAEVDKLMADFYPEIGLDADGAQKLMEQFDAKLKYYVAPDSPALKDAPPKTGAGHYCRPAEAMAITGNVSMRDGKKWITASKIEPRN